MSTRPKNQFVYYCARKRCGAVICALDRPVIVYAKLKCETCGHLTTWRPSEPREGDKRLPEART